MPKFLKFDSIIIIVVPEHTYTKQLALELDDRETQTFAFEALGTMTQVFGFFNTKTFGAKII